jgi:hypothetical protein
LIAYLPTKLEQAMADKIRKNHKEFTPDQRLEYAKLMVEDKYTNQRDGFTGAGATAVSR